MTKKPATEKDVQTMLDKVHELARLILAAHDFSKTLGDAGTPLPSLVTALSSTQGYIARLRMRLDRIHQRESRQ